MLRPLSGPLRKVLSRKYFKMSESYIDPDGGKISD